MSWKDGAYEATSQSFTLIFRLDLAGANSTGTISCDLYQNASAGNFAFLETFRTQTPPSVSESKITADLIVPGTDGAAQLILQADVGGAAAATFRRLDGNPPTSPLVFHVQFKSPFQREITCEVDHEPNVPLPEPALVFSSAPLRISWQDCLRRAGLNVIPSIGDGEIPARDAWQRRDLLAAAYDTTQDKAFNAGVSGTAYLALVSQLADEPNTLGLMFDPDRRRGASVFYGAISANFPVKEECNSVYVYCVVHELAHCFNLPHAFESDGFAPDGFSARTFTNYPDRFEGLVPTLPGIFTAFNDATIRFWSCFDFRFAREELLELRHGRLFDILTGGTPYRGEDSAFRLPVPMDMGNGRNSLVLELRIQPDRHGNLFRYGEPVHVEVKLKAVHGEVEVDCALDPSAHDIEFHIRRPDGDEAIFQSVMDICRAVEKQMLTPAKPSRFADICLSYSRRGFIFVQPGRYMIQALLRTGQSFVLSNPLKMMVRFPTEAEEEWVAPTFEEEVNTYFSVEGCPALRQATNLLDDLASNLPDHPLARYYMAFQAMLSTHGYVPLSRMGSSRGPAATRGTEAKQPQSDSSLYANALRTSFDNLGRADLSARAQPFSNTFLERLLRMACHAFGKEDDKLGKKLFTRAHRELFANRQIPAGRVLPLSVQEFWKNDVDPRKRRASRKKPGGREGT